MIALPTEEDYVEIFKRHLDNLLESAVSLGRLSRAEVDKLTMKKDEIVKDFEKFISGKYFSDYRDAVEAFIDYYRDIEPSIYDLFYYYLHPEEIIEKEIKRAEGRGLKDIIKEAVIEALRPIYPTGIPKTELVLSQEELDRIINIMEEIIYGTSEERAYEYYVSIHGDPNELPDLPRDIIDMCCPVPPDVFRSGFLVSHVVVDMIKRLDYMVGIEMVEWSGRFMRAPRFSAWVHGHLYNVDESPEVLKYINLYGVGKDTVIFRPKYGIPYGVFIVFPTRSYAYVFFTPLKEDAINFLKDQRRLHREYIMDKVRKSMRRRKWVAPEEVSAVQAYLISKLVAIELWRLLRGGMP